MASLLVLQMHTEFAGLDDWIVACMPVVEKSLRNERVDDWQMYKKKIRDTSHY
jgi:hypothetical protein